jgi:uncharacterized protein
LEELHENSGAQETVQPIVSSEKKVDASRIPPPWQRSGSFTVLIMFIVSMMGFMVIGPLVGFLLSLPFFEGSLFDFVDALQNPMSYPEVKLPYFIIQGTATFVGLACIPALYYYSIEKRNPFELLRPRLVSGRMLLVTAGIVISFMAVNSVIIEWNAGLSFPEFMKGFEQWAREIEDRAAELTKFFTQFNSIGEFILAFVVIAVFAGIGEELVFRGMLQPQLLRATGNIHVAIWTSAILFSAIHMQFFGFVPRMLLGALFGYLYYWSGSLIIPMFAHFVNNGFSVVMMYLNQRDVVNVDVESTESAPLYAVVVFTLVAGALMFYFKRFYDTRNSEPA